MRKLKVRDWVNFVTFFITLMISISLLNNYADNHFALNWENSFLLFISLFFTGWFSVKVYPVLKRFGNDGVKLRAKRERTSGITNFLHGAVYVISLPWYLLQILLVAVTTFGIVYHTVTGVQCVLVCTTYEATLTEAHPVFAGVGVVNYSYVNNNGETKTHPGPILLDANVPVTRTIYEAPGGAVFFGVGDFLVKWFAVLVVFAGLIFMLRGYPWRWIYHRFIATRIP